MTTAARVHRSALEFHNARLFVAGQALSNIGTFSLVGLAAIALGSSLVWTALSPTPVVFLASMLYFGLVVVAYTTASQALVQQHSPADMSGRMMSLYTLGSMGTTPIGAVLVGLIIDHVSPRAAVGLGGTSAILCGGVLLLRALWPATATRSTD
jgi:MFS family permease